MNSNSENATTVVIKEDEVIVCFTKREIAENPSRLSTGNPSSAFLFVSLLKLLIIKIPLIKKARELNNNRIQKPAAINNWGFKGLKLPRNMKNNIISGMRNIRIEPYLRQYILRKAFKFIIRDHFLTHYLIRLL
jgi:hypothetical protein